MRYSDNATKLHKQGNNCAQSVLIAASEDIGLNIDISKSIAEGFGGGVRSGEICGALSGAIMALGIYGSSAADYKQFIESFRDHFGAIRCSDLKGVKHSCDELIKYSADLLQNYIEREK